jgi:membrane-associated phospholipid phosphatase
LKRYSFVIEIWLILFLGTAALVAVAFARIDLPAASYFWRSGRFLHPLDKALGSTIILSIESVVVVALVLARLLRGHISRFGETLAIACLASICTYAVNSEVLKVFFGVPNPMSVIHGARHAFNLWKGSENSSFPSGHMMLAGSFAGVFMRLYRTSRAPLAALLLIAAGVLVVGDWHFVSDVVAGTFLGVTLGILAAEAWTAHSIRQA